MSEEQENEGANRGRKPDYVAYSVRDTADGKGFFNKVGAGWVNRDGEGINVSLDAMPVNGRICLRELREERNEAFEEQRRNDDRPRERSRNRGRER